MQAVDFQSELSTREAGAFADIYDLLDLEPVTTVDRNLTLIVG